MLETTKEQRKRWLKDAAKGIYLAPRSAAEVCRDVDTLVVALREVHDEGCLDCEKALPCKAGAVLA
jgi:hypothetical protein